MGGLTMTTTMRLLILVIAFTALVSATPREKPADWDDEVDGKWEPPTEDEPASFNIGDGVPAAETPPPPPPVEQYLSQEPDSWANTFATTRLWEVINKDDQAGLDEMIAANPRVIFARAEDGRGPLFWAYEYGRTAMIKQLEDLGIDNTLKDKAGTPPTELAPAGEL